MGFPSIPVRGFTFTSATLADFGENAQTGDVAFDSKGRSFILVKNGAASLANGIVCRTSVGATPGTAGDLIVVLADAVTDVAVCANNTGAAVTASHYFWGIMTGRGYALGGAAIGDGVEMVHYTTDGTVGPITTGATSSHLGYAISDVTTTVDNAVFWSLPSKRAGA